MKALLERRTIAIGLVLTVGLGLWLSREGPRRGRALEPRASGEALAIPEGAELGEPASVATHEDREPAQAMPAQPSPEAGALVLLRSEVGLPLQGIRSPTPHRLVDNGPDGTRIRLASLPATVGAVGHVPVEVAPGDTLRTLAPDALFTLTGEGLSELLAEVTLGVGSSEEARARVDEALCAGLVAPDRWELAIDAARWKELWPYELDVWIHLRARQSLELTLQPRAGMRASYALDRDLLGRGAPLAPLRVRLDPPAEDPAAWIVQLASVSPSPVPYAVREDRPWGRVRLGPWRFVRRLGLAEMEREPPRLPTGSAYSVLVFQAERGDHGYREVSHTGETVVVPVEPGLRLRFRARDAEGGLSQVTARVGLVFEGHEELPLERVDLRADEEGTFLLPVPSELPAQGPFREHAVLTAVLLRLGSRGAFTDPLRVEPVPGATLDLGELSVAAPRVALRVLGAPTHERGFAYELLRCAARFDLAYEVQASFVEDGALVLCLDQATSPDLRAYDDARGTWVEAVWPADPPPYLVVTEPGGRGGLALVLDEALIYRAVERVPHPLTVTMRATDQATLEVGWLWHGVRHVLAGARRTRTCELDVLAPRDAELYWAQGDPRSAEDLHRLPAWLRELSLP